MELLNKHALIITKPRKLILDLLLAEHGPFTVEEIIHKLPKNSCDRATIYRSLNQFVDIGLVSVSHLDKDLVHYEYSDPHGAEHLKDAMIGNILFVTWKDVFLTFIVYSLVGLVHFIFRRQLWDVTRGKISSFLWDFLFYFLFGIVITFSTHHAGVLVVFSILVGPAAMSKKLIEHSLKKRLLLSWVFGILAIFISFFLSFKFDLPTGAAIVTVICCLFFFTLVICAIKDYLNIKSVTI